MLRYTENSIGVTEFPFKLYFCTGYKCALQTQLINSDNQSDPLHRKTTYQVQRHFNRHYVIAKGTKVTTLQG